MRFSLSMMLYGGIRPTEVSRLQDGDINWEEGLVIIRHRDTSLLRSRYMVPARRKDAEAFWQGAGLPRSAKTHLQG